MLRKVLLPVLSVAIICLLTAAVFAQATPPAKEKPATTETQKSTAPKKAANHIVGTVVSFDPVANTIVIKTKKGDETLPVDPAAKIMIDKKEAKLADLTKDMKVSVVFKTKDGKKVATAIKKTM